MAGSSYTTLADVKRVLGNLFTDADLLPYVNQSLEALVNMGIWKGVIGYAAFPSVNNTFALPYQYLAVIGAAWFRCSVPVFGQFHDFVEGGPGLPIANLPPEGIVEDLGDTYATAIDPPTSYSTLRIQTDLPIDNGKVFRVFGVSNGIQVDDVFGQGMYITVNTNETTVFDQVTGIQPPMNDDGSSAMIGAYTVYSVSPTGVQTNIAYIYPNQVYPQFRRYRIGVTSSSNNQFPNAVTVLVRRRYMPVFKDSDWIIPGNIRALKSAMQAIDTEASRNDATKLWAQAAAALDQELHATRGSARPEMNYEVLGSGALFTNVF